MPNLPNHFLEHNRRAGGSWIVINPGSENAERAQTGAQCNTHRDGRFVVQSVLIPQFARPGLIYKIQLRPGSAYRPGTPNPG